MSSRGASRMSDIDPEHLVALNEGRVQARTLAEALAIDHSALLMHAVPGASVVLMDEARRAQQLGIVRRMGAIGLALRQYCAPDVRKALASHPSDTVRGWTCFAAVSPVADVDELLVSIRSLADDEHFAVREWAWMAVRPGLGQDLSRAISLLSGWTTEESDRLRRFASEVLRPRGVWARHIGELKEQPELGLPILEPLRADASRYVQDSVANWINDASRTRPDWVTELCARWATESPTPETQRITARALRSVTARAGMPRRVA